GGRGGRGARWAGGRAPPGAYVRAVARPLGPFQSASARGAFLQTLRAVIDVHGQRVSATDRLYLLESMPTMIVWGERDNTIPLAHGRRAHEAIPHSQVRTLPGAAHFPHLDDPDALSHVLREFVSDTRPGRIEDADWGAVLAGRAPPRRGIGSPPACPQRGRSAAPRGGDQGIPPRRSPRPQRPVAPRASRIAIRHRSAPVRCQPTGPPY